MGLSRNVVEFMENGSDPIFGGESPRFAGERAFLERQPDSA